jgi:hypothetical protein
MEKRSDRFEFGMRLDRIVECAIETDQQHMAETESRASEDVRTVSSVRDGNSAWVGMATDSQSWKQQPN